MLLRHSSLDEDQLLLSKRQFLKLNTVGQVRKNAIMHISCHYLNSMKPVHLLTMREEPPGIVHCSLSPQKARKSQNFSGLFWFFPHCVVIIGWGMLSYHHFLFWKKVHDHVDVCMAKNVSLWPSGLELYIIEKKKHQSSPKQGGIMVCTKLPLGSVKVQKNWKMVRC